MMTAVAVIGSLVLIGWLIYRMVKQKSVKAHTISYALASLSGVYTFAFFLSMDIHQLFKIVLSILLGAVLIFIAAYLQRQRAGRPR